MPYCFAFGCNCHDSYGRCKFFRFPKEKKLSQKWESLCRRKDRAVGPNDRLCSCHFVDHKKENGPSVFVWNETKRFEWPEAETKPKRTKRTRPAATVTSQNTDTEDPPEASSPAPPVPDVCDGDHCYSISCPSGICQNRFQDMRQEISDLHSRIADLELDLDRRKARRPFTLSDIKNDDEKMLLYTSVTHDVFDIVSATLARFQLSYYSGWKVQSLTLDDQLLVTLMKLKLNLADLDLAERFCISRSAVSNIFYTFIHALHELLFDGILANGLPSQVKCRSCLPQSFRDFAATRAVIDATEMTQDIPSHLNTQSSCYSSYKSRHTVKAVTAVAPNAALVYASKLYPGATSDVAIVDHSRFLDNLKAGDLLLADKGFTLFDRLPPGVSLNIPPFLAGKTHFTQREAELCTKIGRARIHIERANERTKNFQILSHIPSHYRSISTKIFQVCSCLINFQAPLLKEICQNYEM